MTNQYKQFTHSTDVGVRALWGTVLSYSLLHAYITNSALLSTSVDTTKSTTKQQNFLSIRRLFYRV